MMYLTELKTLVSIAPLMTLRTQKCEINDSYTTGYACVKNILFFSCHHGEYFANTSDVNSV
jgi:hypothetical protein